MDAIVNEKQRRIRESERIIDRPRAKVDNSDTSKGVTVNSSISSLVKSVKAKAKLHSGKVGTRTKKR